MANDRPLALVTGASSGIGLAFAKELASRGHDLVVVARSKGKLEELASSLEVAVEVMGADLADAASLRTVEERLRAGRPVDLLVNNAGFGTTGRFVDLPLEEEDQEIRLNVVALTRLASAALPGMVARGRGGLVNVASIAAFQPTPGTATYGATKSYVLSFTQALHEELRGTGVNAVVLCPGFTKTEFQERANYEVKGLAARFWQTPEDVVAAALAALDDGRSVCVPGFQNKVAAVATHLVPRRVLPRLAGLISGQV